MKDETLLLLGVGALAFYFFTQNAGAVGAYSTGYIPSNTIPSNTYNITTYNKQAKENLVSALAAPKSPSAIGVYVAKPTAAIDTERFIAVDYGGTEAAVLDRYQQQTITPKEADKRASNPFMAALPNFSKAVPTGEFMTKAVTTASAAQGGVGWQKLVKTY